MSTNDDQEIEGVHDGGMDQLSEDERVAFQLVEDACAATGADIQAVVKSLNPPYVEIDLVGDFAKEGFGNFGRRLDAFQFLMNLIASRRVRGDVRLVFDCDNYRERRVEALTALAMECAAQVKERQEECELDPLPPHERRIIHNALKDDPTIRTYSEGEDPDRRTIIAPA
jgi:spoIIIJ-associated protein